MHWLCSQGLVKPGNQRNDLILVFSSAFKGKKKNYRIDKCTVRYIYN